MFTVQPFAQQYWNSAWIAAVVTAATLAISSMSGYAFARIRFPGRAKLTNAMRRHVRRHR